MKTKFCGHEKTIKVDEGVVFVTASPDYGLKKEKHVGPVS